MSYSLDIEETPGYLLARLGGPYSLANALAALERIAVVSRERKARAILLDVTGMSGDIPDLDRYDIGKEAAEVFPHIHRVGILSMPGKRVTGFAIDVAANRGLDMRAFLDRAEAAAWLAGA